MHKPMNRIERLYQIDRMLSHRRAVSLDEFLTELSISRATFKRDLEYLRDRLHAPIVWDRGLQGYRFEEQVSGCPAYELPGLWFTSAEIYALLSAQKLLAEIEPGILAQRVGPLQNRLKALLETAGHPAGDVLDRVRLLSMGRRQVEPQFFSLIAKALLERQCLSISTYVRGRGEENLRTISPQRLVHYRDNWYLDTWCHLRRALRTFAVENIRRVTPLNKVAREIPESELQAYFASSYGIFAGPPKATATLLFTPERARWVAGETWHPRQQGEHLPDGSFRLKIPYADPRELVMDILRHGASVIVEGPESLRALIHKEAQAVAKQYR